MSISEVDDLIKITIFGPNNKYFGIGFGSNSMANTYAIVVAGEHSDHSPNFWEQKLDKHGAGYTLQPSFVVEEHIRHSGDNTQQITLVRRLSTALELDEYWLFSCGMKFDHFSPSHFDGQFDAKIEWFLWSICSGPAH